MCCRLNAEEQVVYSAAKKKGFLVVKGTGYRKERKGSPLCNTYRQAAVSCTACRQHSIVLAVGGMI